jgi:hypothetical protein
VSRQTRCSLRTPHGKRRGWRCRTTQRYPTLKYRKNYFSLSSPLQMERKPCSVHFRGNSSVASGHFTIYVCGAGAVQAPEAPSQPRTRKPGTAASPRKQPAARILALSSGPLQRNLGREPVRSTAPQRTPRTECAPHSSQRRTPTHSRACSSGSSMRKLGLVSFCQ